MIPLIRKELRALVPLGVLAFILISGDLITRPFTERLDEGTWASISAIEPGEGGSLAFLDALLAFFFAYAAFPREHDEGTIAYLGSLPITRRAIFGAKVFAGLAMLVGFVALGQVTNWMLQLPNPQSLSGSQFSLSIAVTAAALQSAFAVVAYCHGLLASSLRRFGLLPYAVLTWLVLAIEAIEPSLGWTNPASIARLAYHGRTLLVPWSEIAIHGALALVALGLAYAAWMGPLERAREWLTPKREGRSVVLSLSMGCATVVVVVVVFGLLVFVAVRDGRDDGANLNDDEGVAWQTADATTEQYVFTYPTNLATRASRLIGAADAIASDVRAMLVAAESPTISVDLAETSGHHEGIAAGTRIRMGLVGQDDEQRLRHVLAHETTHVFQGRESDRRLMDQGGSTRFFLEGSAEWVAYEVLPGLEAERRQSRIVAVASWERHELRFEDVIEDELLRSRFDTSLVYSLGETWTAAIASACGAGAVGDVMRAIGREDAPDDLEAVALWQDALQRVGCSEPSVRAAWDASMTSMAREERAAIDAIPRAGAARGGSDGADTIIVATLDRPSPPGARWSIRVRRDRGASDAEMRGSVGIVEGDDRVRFRVPSSLTFPRFDMQICVVPEGGNWTFCESWQSG